VRKAGSQSISNLSIDDLAEVIADAVKSSERRVVEHLGRVVRLINMKANARDETARLKNFHHRLCAIESELRQMGRKT
jgi:hypothetical protein